MDTKTQTVRYSSPSKMAREVEEFERAGWNVRSITVVGASTWVVYEIDRMAVG